MVVSSTFDIMLDVLTVAKDWSYWDGPPSHAVQRDVELPRELSERVALVVKGVRRCGKSTLLAQLMSRYELRHEHCVFLNFEDPRLSNALTYETLEALVVAFRAQCGEKPKLTFFLDEIQWVDGWQKWLRTKLERPKHCSFVITGSNAQLLSGELGSSLTGRHLSVELFPFSLREARALRPRLTVRGFLETGGFPEVLRSKDGPQLLRQYFHDIVERDVRERVAARSSHALRQLVQMVFESAGAELSVRRIAAASGIAVDTAQSYLDACEFAYLVFACPYFAYSERKRADYNKKYYPIDTALRQVAVTPTGADLGKLLECATYALLRRTHERVFYWRGKGEVDFVVQDTNGRITPVQVTLNEVQERHKKALDSFYETFPHAQEAKFVTQRTFADLEESLADTLPG
jgi:predicted AAA+ superfamily ATPase